MDLKIKNDFESIYKEYAPQVYRYLLKIGCPPQDAEDITHDTFVKALLHIEQYRGEGKLSIWLCQIAKNTYMSMCRKDKYLNHNADAELSQSNENIEEYFFDKETAFAIHKVLHTLNEPYKEIFSLRTFGELSFKQIAELFGKTEAWARVTYHRARLRIKEELK